MELSAAWIVLAVIVFLVILLYTEWLRPAISFMIALLVLVVGNEFTADNNLLTAQEALSGFANEQLAIIVLLLIMGAIFEKTKVISVLFRGLFSGKSQRSFLAKLTGVVGVSSAFLNNTPLVAMFMPSVYNWARERGLSPSKFLIPLSYASILGGCATLIGTSTNLIASGLAVQYGEAPLAIFDFAPVGVVMLVLGMLFLLILGPRLLPDYKGNVEQLMEARQYFLETQVKVGSPLIGQSVEAAGLRNLQGMFLVEIIRGDSMIRPVSPGELLEEGDELYLAGNPESIADLTQPKLGLSLPKACNIPLRETSDVVEVVIAHNSRLVGKKVKNSDFRGRYDGAILAIHRNGEKLWGKIGELTLRSGDVLLVLTGKDFFVRTRNNPAFYVISKPAVVNHVELGKTLVLTLGMLAAIALAVLGWVSLFVSLSVLLVLCLLMRITHPAEIRNKIDFNLVFIIAAGLGIGQAMNNSGAAALISEHFLSLSGSLGVLGILAALFLVTNLLSAFLTSKAAVSLVIPVAISLVQGLSATHPELTVTPFILVVAFGGAANFLTPIGYQTNLMVYGPGGYKFKDFLRIGAPLTLLYLVVCVFILGWQFDLY